MKETGSIKFHCNWHKTAPLPDAHIRELNQWRQQLYALMLIGENDEGIGYGNISCRQTGNRFIISASGTGKIARLDGRHYCMVTGFDIECNEVTAEGPMLASSESMTHAMIYTLRSDVNCVMHVHHKQLWEYLLKMYPSTHPGVAYGTPAMAFEIQRILQDIPVAAATIFAMAGHEDGVIAFGRNAAQAGRMLLEHLHRVV